MTDSIPLATEACRSMAIRIQPRELEIPAGNPFEHDLLRREESIKALTAVIGSIEGPCVMAVDAGWGMGKTTFLRMWAQYLRNERFPVVEFNAWETDFAQDPFIALASEIATGLQSLGTTSGRLGGRRLRSGLTKVIRTAPGATARVAASGIPFIGTQLAQELQAKPLSPRQTMAETYDETKGALESFRVSLEEVGEASAKDNDGKPLVVLVDELDRCRPTYAIELLEVAKHLFSVDRIVFVLCLDRAQLACSVKALYGESFDAGGYLRRFFDIDYRLPSPDRAALVDAVLNSTGIHLVLRDLQQRFPYGNGPTDLSPLVRTFFTSPQFSLRQVHQAMHRLGLIVASSEAFSPEVMTFLITLLLLRTCEPEVYRRLVTGDATDEDAVDVLFGHPSLNEARESVPGATAEGVLISCALFANLDQHQFVNRNSLPLLERHEQHRDNRTAIGRNWYAEGIVNMVHRWCEIRKAQSADGEQEFASGQHLLYQAVRHLELFPEGLDDAGVA